MNKRAALAAVISTTAILTLGLATISFGATGWVEADKGWTYYDSNGEQATDTWKKNGDNWFYLDSSGYMVLDSIVEDGEYIYYVNEDGVMATNQWVVRANDDDTENSAADIWYYFQTNGRAYMAGESTIFKVINGKKYAFDSDGKMLYGWVDDNSQLMYGDYDWRTATYYCGADNDGALATGWREITVEDDNTEEEKEGSQDYFFYFNTNGKKLVSSSKTINGEKYTFDENGVMQTEWLAPASGSAAGGVATKSISGYQYFNYEGIGSRNKGWFYAIPDKAIDKKNYDDKIEKWFYASNGGTIAKSQLKTINGRKYAFNEVGEMMTGLQAIVLDSDGNTILKNFKLEMDADLQACNAGNPAYKEFDFTNADVYYFGSDDAEDGFMRTGAQRVYFDGEEYDYLFGKSGSVKGKGFGSQRANNNTDIYHKNAGLAFSEAYIYNKSAIYVKGKKVKADETEKYAGFNKHGELVSAKASLTAGDVFLVNASGTIMKSKKNMKNSEDFYYCTDSIGVITYAGAEKCKTHVNEAGH